MDWLWIAPLSAFISLLFAGILAYIVLKRDKGTERMQEIHKAIRQGAIAYLKRQYQTIFVIVVILAALLYIVFSWQTSFSFLLGAGCSLLAGFVAMDISTRANVRVAAAAKRGMNDALTTAFYSGAIMGLCVVALSLLGIVSLYIVFDQDLGVIVGFSFGASIAALFAQLGGGIYTKAADVGADLVGKLEAGIPEDDPRNPAVIADLVGDNVGDCAGRSADLFESITGQNIGAMILGLALMPFFGINGVIFPLVIMGAALIATIISVLFVRAREGENPMSPMWRGLMVNTFLCAVFFYFIVDGMLGDINLYYAVLVGLATNLLIGVITDYYTSYKYRPVKEIAEASETGAATNIITGYAVSLEATALPVIVLSGALLAAFYLGNLSGHGIFGTAVATMGMLAPTAFILAMDGFGPVADNAGGIVEMSGSPASIRKITDRLDAVGNTTKALAKGFAVGSAALAAMLLFQAYLQTVQITVIDLAIPKVTVGLMLGALLPFVFASLAIRAVGKAAFQMIKEVRRQFKEIPGIMKGTAKPDYSSCVDISTKAALRQMVAPGLLAVFAPIVVGFALGAEAIGGFLMGAITSGVLLAIKMNTGGAAWDNAKKYIELGNYGGKGSLAHKAAVVGDTLGDPLKDTAGPSLNVLVKLLNTITLIFGLLFVTYHFL